jgi:predicted enzyme related to lactoylglutathione lyase
VNDPSHEELMNMGKVVHFEIPADDVARAKKFYSTVFNWSLSEFPEMEYTMARTVESDQNGMPKEPGAINGGMLKRGDPVKSPVITIDVDDIDQSAKTIEKNGGKMVRQKMPVGDMGFAAYFKDSEGNVVGLWQNAQ